MDALVVDGLHKVFGPRPDEVLRLLEQGPSKDDIFARTNTTVGVQDPSFLSRTQVPVEDLQQYMSKAQETSNGEAVDAYIKENPARVD